VSSGAQRFTILSKELRKSNSVFRTMGFSFEEINDTLATYLDITTRSGNVQSKYNTNQTALIAGAVKFGTELNYLSSITGKSRKELATSVKEQAERGDVQAALAMTEQAYGRDVAKQFAEMSAQMAAFGPKAQNVFSELFAFPGYINSASQEMLVAAGPMAKAIESITHRIKEGSITTDEAQFLTIKGMQQSLKLLDQQAILGDVAAVKAAKELRAQFGPMIAVFGYAGKYSDEQLKDMILKGRQKAAAEQKNQDNLKMLGDAFRNIYGTIETKILQSKIFEKLVSGLNEMAGFMTSPDFEKAVEWVGQKLLEFGNWLLNIFSGEGREQMMRDISIMWDTVVVLFKKALYNLFNSIVIFSLISEWTYFSVNLEIILLSRCFIIFFRLSNSVMILFKYSV
jgi:hypothetical protein